MSESDKSGVGAELLALRKRLDRLEWALVGFFAALMVRGFL
jgi:hypothetical protein